MVFSLTCLCIKKKIILEHTVHLSFNIKCVYAFQTLHMIEGVRGFCLRGRCVFSIYMSGLLFAHLPHCYDHHSLLCPSFSCRHVCRQIKLLLLDIRSLKPMNAMCLLPQPHRPWKYLPHITMTTRQPEGVT